MEKILIASTIINIMLIVILITTKKIIKDYRKIFKKNLDETLKMHESLIDSLEKEFVKKDIQIIKLMSSIDFLSEQNTILSEKAGLLNESFINESDIIHKQHLKNADRNFIKLLQTSK